MVKVALLSLLLVICSPAAEAAGPPRFSELTAAVSDRSLLLYATAEGTVNEEMRSALQSGLPLDFTFTVELHRDTSGGPGELVATRSFHHRIRYNTLTNDWLLTFEEHSNRRQTFADAAEAEAALNTLLDVDVVPVGRLIPDNSYSLQIKADLFHKGLPPGLESILPFLTWDDRRIDWHSLHFSYRKMMP